MTAIQKPLEHEYKMFGARVPFESINEPGTYLSNWTGHLIRIPEDGFKPGRSPLIEIRGKEPFFVTKLSDDPYLTITKARMLAADLDLQVNF
jgi:hypothetical protein